VAIAQAGQEEIVSVVIIGKVWDSDLESKLKFTALSLADFASHDGNGVHPSNEYLTWRTGMSGTTIRRHMAELRKLGVLVAQENMAGGRGRIPIYRLNVDALPKRKPWRETRWMGKGAQSDCLLESERQSSATEKAVVFDHKGSQKTLRNKEDPGGYPGVYPGVCVRERESDREPPRGEDQKRTRSKVENLEPKPTPRPNSKAGPPPRGTQQRRREQNERAVASAGVRDGIGRTLLLAAKHYGHYLDTDDVRAWAKKLAAYTDEQIEKTFSGYSEVGQYFPRFNEILGRIKTLALQEAVRLREEQIAAKRKRERDEWYANATDAERADYDAREARRLG